MKKLFKILSHPMFKIITFLLLIIVLFKFVDIKQFLMSYQTISKYSILMLILLILFYWMLNILSLYVLFIPLKKIKFIKFAKVQIISLLLGILTPSQLGESTIIFFLKKNNISIQKSLSLFMLNKVINLFFILITGFFVMAFLNINLWGIAKILAVSSFLFLIILSTKLKKFVKKIITKFLNRYISFFKTLYSFTNTNLRYLLLNLIINIAKIFTIGTLIYLAFSIFNIHIGFFKLFTILNINRIIGQIPISLSGIGIVDGGLAVMLSNLGYNYTKIISAMFFFRIVSFIISSFIALSIFISSKLEKN